jgi:hypothetical protein
VLSREALRELDDRFFHLACMLLREPSPSSSGAGGGPLSSTDDPAHAAAADSDDERALRPTLAAITNGGADHWISLLHTLFWGGHRPGPDRMHAYLDVVLPHLPQLPANHLAQLMYCVTLSACLPGVCGVRRQGRGGVSLPSPHCFTCLMEHIQPRAQSIVYNTLTDTPNKHTTKKPNK